MSPAEICAVILDRGDEGTAATVRALAQQSRLPDQVILATTRRRASPARSRFGADTAILVARSPLAAAVKRGIDTAAEWIWLLDGRTTPQPNALESLIEAAAWPDRSLCLLSSMLVADDGTLLTADAPLPQALDVDLATTAFEHRTCSLRVVGYGSLLVRAEALRQALPPPGRAGADLVWSARLLAGGVGLLVPQSLAVRDRASTAGERLGLLAGWARLLLSDAVALAEKPWIGLIYFDRARSLIAEWVRDLR